MFFRLLLQLTQSQQTSFALERNLRTQQEIEDKMKGFGFKEDTLQLITEVSDPWGLCEARHHGYFSWRPHSFIKNKVRSHPPKDFGVLPLRALGHFIRNAPLPRLPAAAAGGKGSVHSRLLLGHACLPALQHAQRLAAGC